MVKYSVEAPSDGSINASEFIKNTRKKRKLRRKFFVKAGKTVVNFMTGRQKGNKVFSKMASIGSRKTQKLLKNKPEFKEYKQKRSKNSGTCGVNFKREVHSVIFKPLRLEDDKSKAEINFPPIFEIESTSTKDSTTVPSCVDEDDSQSETESINFADIDDTDTCDVIVECVESVENTESVEDGEDAQGVEGVEGNDCDDEVWHDDRSETPSLSIEDNIQPSDEACQEVVEEKTKEQVVGTTTDNPVLQPDTISNVTQCKEDPYHDDNDGKFDICGFVKSWQSDTSSDMGQCKEDPYHDDNDGKLDICELPVVRKLKSIF